MPSTLELSNYSPASNALHGAALQALRVSESRYRRLFEAAQDGILLLNTDTGQIEDVNPYLIKRFGCTHAEFLGKKIWKVGPFADIKDSKDVFAQLQTKGYVRYDNLPLKFRTGVPIAVGFVSNAYDREGIEVIQCNVRNITKRRQAERKLTQSRTKLRQLSISLQRAREDDRAHFARELHDQLGQNLTGLRIDFNSLAKTHDDS